jgi:hypothetical protein
LVLLPEFSLLILLSELFLLILLPVDPATC